MGKTQTVLKGIDSQTLPVVPYEIIDNLCRGKIHYPFTLIIDCSLLTPALPDGMPAL